MKQLLQIIQNLKLSEDEKSRVEKFFSGVTVRHQLVYPRRLASVLGLDTKITCEVLLELTLEGYLQHVTVPKVKGSEEMLESDFIEGVISCFSEEDKFEDSDFNELSGKDVEPIAAFRRVG